MAKSKTPKPLPTPLEARLAAGLKWKDLRDRARVSFQTIYRCEKTGTWPKTPALRAAYMAACGVAEPAPGAAA